jgi:chromate transport protein ChrA
MADTFLQWPIVSQYVLPFLLVFVIVFGILEKTKLFGDGKKQLDAMVSGVIALIFVGAVSYTHMVQNLTLFLTLAIVAIFVIMLLWGFVWGDAKEGFKPEKWMKWLLAVVAGIAFIWAVIWATDSLGKIQGFFGGSLGQTIITNGIFLIVIAVALALILIPPKK